MPAPAKPPSPGAPPPSTVRPANRHCGWVPKQHGAWAMLALPWLVGAVRSEYPLVRTIPILLVCLFGYLAFNAVSLYLKSGRRPRYRRATVTYSAGTTIAGSLATIVNPAIATWAIAYLPLAAAALVLAAYRADRSVLSGAITIAASSVVSTVVQYPNMFQANDWGTSIQLFGYFFGTVLYVKTMLRNRGQPAYLIVSVGYHLASAIGALVAGHCALAIFFAAATGRAVAMPRAAASIRPRVIGLVEIAFSVALLVIFLTR